MISHLLALCLVAQNPNPTAERSPWFLIMNVFASQKLNDGYSTLDAIPKPVFVLKYSAKNYQSTLISAVLFHKTEARFRFNDDWHFFAGAETFVWRGGDSPRIKGDDLDEYSFSGHRFQIFSGFIKSLGIGTNHYELSMKALAQYHYYYDRPGSATFVMPTNAYDVGAHIQLDGPSRPPSEMNFYGFRPHLMFGAYRRLEHDSFGVVGFQKKIQSWIEGSATLHGAVAINKSIVPQFKLTASFVSDADRLNAVSNGSLKQEPLGILYGDIKSDRVINGELGFRFHPFESKTFAFRPFAHLLWYREVTPTLMRSDLGFGAGLKVMGSVGNRFMWNLLYGNIARNRVDKSMVHEARVDLSYLFLP